MIKTSAVLTTLWLLTGIAPAPAAERPTVVELFTSEGCSSCPPADALLAQLATRPDVLALSFHVDYWNRLGWKDPYSSQEATALQRHYARQLALPGVYTPQIVVDGAWQAVGSDEGAVASALDDARRAAVAVPMTLAIDHRQARVSFAAHPIMAPAAVVLIGFDRRHVDAVRGGENDGRTLTHVDVVRGFAEIGRFTGSAGVIETPLAWRSERVAAILQAADGHILGAAVAGDSPP
jgi:hypothetical protein